MGKKGKGKDDKAPAEDVFDPLAIETKTAQTAILMLESPEDEIQARACEGIYKFAYKCDENRKVLLDNGACEGLLKLLSTDDRTIRRNALMALATMTMNSEVRKQLRKTNEAVQLFVRLLNPEEFTTTREFATLALSNMAKEFGSIAAILQCKGLENLLECLKEDDPDVQKNAVECIALLLQDFEAKSSIKDSSGLEALLELLESEYAVIQELALQSLIRATQDSSNRAALRDMESLKIFVNMIGKPEYNDLHVHALHVLANCADDYESLLQLKENGGLLRFVAFITDQTPPPEEQKEAKGKGKGKGSAKKKKGEEDKKEAESAPSHTLPEVKMHAAKAIARAARSDDAKRVLHDCEAEKMLVLLLSHEDEKVRVAAATAIAVMSENFVCQEAVVKNDGLDPLVKFVKSDNRELKEASSLAVANLTSGNMPICLQVASISHGVDNLVGCLSNENERIASNGLTALINMATDDSLRQKILGCGLISALPAALGSQSFLVQRQAAAAAAAFIVTPSSRAEFRNSKNLPLLLPLLLSNNSDVRRSASHAVSVLAADEDTSIEIYRLGGLELLQSITQSDTKRNKFAELATEKLLEHNLCLKYALTGRLSVTDRIPEIFYDAGQLRPDSRLSPLEILCQQPVNTRRPILLLNSTPPPEPPEPTEADESETRSTPQMETAGGAGTPNAKKSKSPGGSAKGKRAAAAEAEAAAEAAATAAAAAAAAEQQQQQQDEPKPFTPPEDPELLSCIEEAKKIVAECRNQRDEILVLARFVANKLGGAIHHDELMSFSYELPMSQLKMKLKSNVVPLGMVKAGIHYHRALLFKLLADRCGINCSLIRGEYNRAWNEVWLADSDGQRSYPPSEYIVDLVFEPGQVYRHDTVECVNYKKI